MILDDIIAGDRIGGVDMAIREQEDLLFARWKEHRKGFVRDGIVDETAYLSSHPRIVYLLKEVNSQEDGWDLRAYLREGGQSRTWNNIARWTHGIRMLYRDREEPQLWTAIEHVDEAFRAAQLRTICAVNVKKVPGGAYANSAEIQRYQREDAAWLQEQLDLYRPHITICCQVDPPHADALAWRATHRGIWHAWSDARLIIRYVHPEIRCPANIAYYALMDAIREIRGGTP